MSAPPFPSAKAARDELSLLFPRRRVRRLAAAVVAASAAVVVTALSAFWASDRFRLAAVEREHEDVMRQADLVAAGRQQDIWMAADVLHWLEVQARPVPKDGVRAKIAEEAQELELKLDALARTAEGGSLGGRTVTFGRAVIALARSDTGAAVRRTADWQPAGPDAAGRGTRLAGVPATRAGVPGEAGVG